LIKQNISNKMHCKLNSNTEAMSCLHCNTLMLILWLIYLAYIDLTDYVIQVILKML